jgi:hypothetical protein
MNLINVLTRFAQAALAVTLVLVVGVVFRIGVI